MVARLGSRDLAVREQRVGLDTSLFIYFLQDHPRYGGWCASLFDRFIGNDKALRRVKEIECVVLEDLI